MKRTANISRRHLASAIAGAAMAAVPGQAPAQEAPPASELERARANLQRSREQMAAVKIPGATEPAFQFRA